MPSAAPPALSRTPQLAVSGEANRGTWPRDRPSPLARTAEGRPTRNGPEASTVSSWGTGRSLPLDPTRNPADLEPG